MDNKKILENLISIVKEDSNLALGCTEPVAVAYAANQAGSVIDKSSIRKIEIKTSSNIYKNGKSVKIPNTGSLGLDLAASVGALTETTKDPLLVFSKVTKEEVTRANELIDNGVVSLEIIDSCPDIYINIIIETENDKSESIVSNSHTHLEKLILNGKILVENEYVKSDKLDSFEMKSLSFAKLKEIIDNADYKDIAFTLEGIEVNKKAAEAGLESEEINLGKTLIKLKNQGILEDNFITDTRIYTAAAADMRMSGGQYPIMTSGGSGNQGIGVILPIAMVGEFENADNEKLAKAIFFAHCINRYVKEYSGKLSGMCGCAIGSAIGATAGITYLLGGDDVQIAGACSNIFANLTGLVCDGAKESCSLKLSTSSEEAVISAYLAINGMISESKIGVLGTTIEETIANIGKLSREGFTKVDEVMIKIIED